MLRVSHLSDEAISLEFLTLKWQPALMGLNQLLGDRFLRASDVADDIASWIFFLRFVRFDRRPC